MPGYRGADGAELYYDDGGPSAPPVIALAGGAARHPAYLGDLAGLAERHRLVVPHLRGVGLSPLPADPTRASWWQQAEDLESLRVHLGLEQVTVLAHSAGTRLAIGYAARYPRRVARMVLVTPPAGYLVDEQSDAQTMLDRRRGEPALDRAVAALRQGAPVDADDEAFNAWQVLAAPAGYASWTPREQAHAGTGRWSLPAALAYFSVEPPPDLPARLGGVPAPVLVVAGAHDCLTGLAPVLALSKLFPAGEAVVLDDCGHYPWVEQPRRFRETVSAFLARGRSGGVVPPPRLRGPEH